MHRIRVGLELSSPDALQAIASGLARVEGVRISAAVRSGARFANLTISTDDPDDVDIARELVWQFDPEAVQHTVVLLKVAA